jgi:hypothetical protein
MFVTAGETHHQTHVTPLKLKTSSAQAALQVDPNLQARAPRRELQLPWEALLTREEVRRGLSYYGSGRRLQVLAAKLLAGKPIKVFTLGGSVTKGSGASTQADSYASLLFQLINSTFPHR